jgi:hypothetical protein
MSVLATGSEPWEPPAVFEALIRWYWCATDAMIEGRVVEGLRVQVQLERETVYWDVGRRTLGRSKVHPVSRRNNDIDRLRYA